MPAPAGAPPAATDPPLNPPTENDGRGFYKSEDNGVTWERISREAGIVGGDDWFSGCTNAVTSPNP